MVFIVVGSWAAYRFSLFISGPILELKSVSIKAAEGELNVNLGKVINVGGEVGSLAKSFEVMMKKLENKIKELEASRMELLRSNEELKTTQAQLVQSEKLAMIGQLAAGVAHEINNPTAFVMGNLGVLKKSIWRINQVMDKYGELEKRVGAMGIAELSKILNELIELKKEIELNYILTDLPDLINESLDGTQRIKKIVSDLRTFSQTDEGVCREADINELVESALTIAWNDLKYKADVVRDYGEVPPVLCYPTQISKAVLNIVMNAAYAIERDGVIKVMTYARGDDAYIEISDNGCGMSDEVLSHLFEPFYTTKPVGKGTGLGLSMVYNVIQKHNGEVYAKSKVGQGSTFFIRLPIVPIEG
jgi:signal transduction histidine kinase